MTENLPAVQERSAALELTSQQTSFTGQQLAVLKTLGMEDATPHEFGALLHFAQRHNLDPFAKQVGLIPFYSGGVKHAPYIAIDGYLALASRTGRFIGIEGPYFCGPDGQWTDVWLSDEPPAAARMTVRYYDTHGREQRQDGTVRYRDRVQKKRDGTPTKIWLTMPSEMLANGAMRLALRRALPDALDAVEADMREQRYVDAETGEVTMTHTPRRLVALQPSVAQLEAELAGDVYDGTDRVGPEDQPTEAVDVPVGDGGDRESLLATGNLVTRIKILQKEACIDDDTYRSQLRKLYGVESSKDLVDWQARELIGRLEKAVDRVQAAATAEPGTEAAVDVETVPDGDVSVEDSTDAPNFDIEGGDES